MDPRSEEPGWRAMFTNARWPTSGALIAETDRAPVAFAGFGPADDAPKVAEVATFYALPEVWGKGVGRRLMDALLQTLEGGVGVGRSG
ncbi:GNAT family N-acetyltransferase [Actinomadura roseirufa]|uniref:GNAT family N-acetyltransferase n=1 Tax=Actinomadura roseirufa TaxID=2094049 RepID=UPI0024159250|nr:GNAT family N-acetyltransferase [Actinomadura roseirufa]